MSAAMLLCPARCRIPSIKGSMGPLPPTSPTLAAVSREVVMGTVCCRYPSAWVPLLTWRGGGDSASRASSACVLTRAKQSGQRGNRAPRGGPSLCGCSGDAGGTQRWRSPTCPHPPCKCPEHPCGPGTGNGAGRWAQAPREQCGTAPAPAAALPAHSHGEPALPVLPRPTHPAMEPAARSPVPLRDFNPAAPTGCNRMGAGTGQVQVHAAGRRQDLSSLLEPSELVAQGEAGLAACRVEARAGSAWPWLHASCRQGDPARAPSTTNPRHPPREGDTGPHPCTSPAPCCCPRSPCAPQQPWSHIPHPCSAM